jgi:hypothetical protein
VRRRGKKASTDMEEAGLGYSVEAFRKENWKQHSPPPTDIAKNPWRVNNFR